MVFSPADTCEHAGLVVMKDETHQYQLARTLAESGHAVTLRRIDENGSTDVASAPIKDGDAGVDLKVRSDGRTYEFLYSDDRGDTWKSLKSGVDARHTSTAAAGGFTGTMVGPYASAKRI